MQLIVDPHGAIHCLYSETLDLTALGSLHMRRASHVEPTEKGDWMVDLAPVNGPTLGPFPKRSEALAAEEDWLTQNWLGQNKPSFPI